MKSNQSKYVASAPSEAALMQMVLDYNHIQYNKLYHIAPGHPKFVSFQVIVKDQTFIDDEMEALGKSIHSNKVVENEFNKLVKGYTKVF